MSHQHSDGEERWDSVFEVSVILCFAIIGVIGTVLVVMTFILAHLSGGKTDWVSVGDNVNVLRQLSLTEQVEKDKKVIGQLTATIQSIDPKTCAMVVYPKGVTQYAEEDIHAQAVFLYLNEGAVISSSTINNYLTNPAISTGLFVLGSGGTLSNDHFENKKLPMSTEK